MVEDFFFESFNLKEFKKTTSLDVTFIQDNHSKSTKGVLRGLHYQLSPYAQGKLLRVIQGEVSKPTSLNLLLTAIPNSSGPSLVWKYTFSPSW